MPLRAPAPSTIWTPFRYIFAILAIIFIAEVGVMYMMPAIIGADPDVHLEAVLDATLLTLLSGPIIWKLLIVPLRAAAYRASRQYAAIVDHALDAIVVVDGQGRITTLNGAAERLLGGQSREVLGQSVASFLRGWSLPKVTAPEHPDSATAAHTTMPDCYVTKLSGGSSPIEGTASSLWIDGEIQWTLIMRDASERRAAEQALADAQRRLVDSAHRAGKAEVATCVLHNVGNVMTNVQVVTATIAGKINKSRMAGLDKAASLLGDHRDDLVSFLTHDARGRQLPNYFMELARVWEREQSSLLTDLDSLAQSIEHVNRIVAAQQTHAKGGELTETVALADLVATAVNMVKASLTRHQVQLRSDVDPSLRVSLDRHKLLQVLVNLLTNARDAVVANPVKPPSISVRGHRSQDDRFRIEITDSGVGIEPENLSAIFSVGYTTKPDGHGYGLHYSAIAVRQLDGAISVRSDGANQGATFTIDLPLTTNTTDAAV